MDNYYGGKIKGMIMERIKVKCYTRVCKNIIEVKPHPSGWELCPDCSKMLEDALARIDRIQQQDKEV